MSFQPKRGLTTTPPTILCESGDWSGIAPMIPDGRNVRSIVSGRGVRTAWISSDSNCGRFARRRLSAQAFQDRSRL